MPWSYGLALPARLQYRQEKLKGTSGRRTTAST